MPATASEWRVEQDDIDSYNIVHFARYAVFAERGAMEGLERWGWSVEALQKKGLELRVRELNMRYLSVARLGDLLLMEASVIRRGLAHLLVRLSISRKSSAPTTGAIAEGTLNFVFVEGRSGRPYAVPARLNDIKL